MMDLSQKLAALLKRPARPADAAAPPEAEAAAVAVLAEAIRAQSERKKWRRVVLPLAALAAAAVGFVAVSALLHTRFDGLEVEAASHALLTRGDASEAVARGGRLSVGARLETTSEGSARMRFPTGSEVWLEQKSALELLSAGVDQSMRLSAGRMRAQVAPLKQGERFRIVTPDTELAVRGTRFTVEWVGVSECAGQAATRVVVEEGTVWVRHGQAEEVLHAGAHWPAGCASAAELAAAAPEPVVARATPARAPSRLAEENQRFAEVRQERLAGRPERALELLDRLKQDFPRGQLQEDVAAEEMRLTAERDPARAQRAARAYLKRFPEGYARPLAEELAAAER